METLSFIANLPPQGTAPVSNFSSSASYGSSENKKAKTKKIVKFALTVLGAVVILIGGAKLLSSTNFSGSQSNTPDVKGARATQDINNEFSFPLKNSQAEQIGSIKYMIEKAELRDEIIVKGQKASAITGRTFVILTVKITNDFRQPVQINTRDYLRLSVNNNDQELLAPDIHNDPVEVQAISTKYTRLGFPINTKDKNLTLLVGEINSEKQKIALTLQ